MTNKWITLKNTKDLDKLPKRQFKHHCSQKILVSSTKPTLNEVYLMYYDFTDNMFHFPSYNVEWKDIPLKPFADINKWMPLPKKPRATHHD